MFSTNTASPNKGKTTKKQKTKKKDRYRVKVLWWQYYEQIPVSSIGKS